MVQRLLTEHSCFQKDIFNIVYLSESLHLYEIADYWRAIIDMNEHQKQRFTKRIIACLYNNLAGKKLAVLGFAFKKDTSDTRESPAITLVSNFVAERARVAIYDPRVPQQAIWRELADNGCDPEVLKRNVSVCSSAYTACEAADAVVVVTEWDEFSNKTIAPAPAADAKEQPLARTGTIKHANTSFGSSRVADQGVLSPPGPMLESPAGFQIPARKSASIIIKDPKNGEIKDFNAQRTFSGGSPLQSQFTDLAPFESPRRQSTGLGTRDPNVPFERTNASWSGHNPLTPIAATFYGFEDRKSGRENFTSITNERLQVGKVTSNPKPSGKLDWARVAKSMRKPMFVFDGRNILDHGKLEALGFRVEAIGKRGTAGNDLLA